LTSLALAVPLIAACGSSASSGSSSQAKAPAAFCQKVLAVLSDGPDPGTDPVGYALSQIGPMEEVHTTDHALATTLSALIAADHALVDSNGSDHAATKAIAKSYDALNAACPGVAP